MNIHGVVFSVAALPIEAWSRHFVMDSVQTAQCIVCSVVVCVLLIITGFLIFILSVYAFAPLMDKVQLRLIETNVTTTERDPIYDYDYS
ncbi:uncharacterized protein LOC120454258 isoform X1 [Drosophila santomea]|uniref:uncharacterized protein LOC120454258 isoform X1 n=1 Tax=Drosophila santomea TaxID=129105 RepID=UPI0019543FA5|nr:uncharacterized protein LOC120454258 isoform X1 [Drosophila santomea]